MGFWDRMIFTLFVEAAMVLGFYAGWTARTGSLRKKGPIP